MKYATGLCIPQDPDTGKEARRPGSRVLIQLTAYTKLKWPDKQRLSNGVVLQPSTKHQGPRVYLYLFAFGIFLANK